MLFGLSNAGADFTMASVMHTPLITPTCTHCGPHAVLAGSGLQIMAETNYPKAPEGIYVLATPVLGGVYLANHVQTTNNSAPVAKLRREWFITYVSSDKAVVPATTACADILSATQLASYTQVGLCHSMWAPMFWQHLFTAMSAAWFGFKKKETDCSSA